MEEKKALALRIAAVEKQLAKQRRKWFLGIWLGYSAVAFWLIKIIDEIDNVLDLLFYNPIEFFGILLASAVLGLISWWVNSLAWSNCCLSINDTVNVYEKLVKEYNNMP